MPLGDVIANPNWSDIERKEQAQRAARSQGLQLALIGYGLLALGLAAWRSAPAWLPFAQLALFAAAFLWMPLRTGIYSAGGRARTLAVAAGALALALGLAALTLPVASPVSGFALRLPPWLNLLNIPLMAGLLFWAVRRHPGLSHSLGLAGRHRLYQAAVGLSLGAAFGLHMWTSMAAMADHWTPAGVSPATLVWFLATTTALAGLGEELTLRGALFSALTAEAGGLRPTVFARILALGAPLYIAPTLHSLSGEPGIAIAYEVGFAVLALALRAAFRSIAAPLAANIAFSVFLAALVIT